MAREIITFEIRPDSPEVVLQKKGDGPEGIAEKVISILRDFTGEDGVETKVELLPFIMGMEILKLTFVRDEGKGDLEELKAKIESFEGVHSAQVIDQRRAIG